MEILRFRKTPALDMIMQREGKQMLYALISTKPFSTIAITKHL